MTRTRLNDREVEVTNLYNRLGIGPHPAPTLLLKDYGACLRYDSRDEGDTSCLPSNFDYPESINLHFCF